jgi:hypothetical protein
MRTSLSSYRTIQRRNCREISRGRGSSATKRSCMWVERSVEKKRSKSGICLPCICRLWLNHKTDQLSHNAPRSFTDTFLASSTFFFQQSSVTCSSTTKNGYNNSRSCSSGGEGSTCEKLSHKQVNSKIMYCAKSRLNRYHVYGCMTTGTRGSQINSIRHVNQCASLTAPAEVLEWSTSSPARLGYASLYG